MTREMDEFLQKMRLCSLCVAFEDEFFPFNAFYAYDERGSNLIIASGKDSAHGAKFCASLSTKSSICGTIALDTNVVNLIKGIQIWGEIYSADVQDKQIYFNKFPFSRAINPLLWRIEIQRAKMTDNRIFFGKKQLWRRDNS